MAGKAPSRILAHQWLTYQVDAYGHELEAGQQATECKRAFYGGAFKAIAALTHLASDSAEPTAEDIALIDDMMTEINTFFMAETAIHNAMGH